MNSIILAYRDRPKHLNMLLRSLSFNNSNFEIVIIDLGSKTNTKNIINQYNFDINYQFIEYYDIFWKTKALNLAISLSKYEYITMLDVDDIVQNDFIDYINHFYNKNDKNIKLCHRVKCISENQIPQNFSNKIFEILNKKNLPWQLERYMINDEIKTNRETQKYDIPLGNSRYTVKKEHIMTIGGYDERYIGYGCEDLDFNLRLFRYLKNGFIPNENTIYTITNNKEKNWKTKELLDNNRNLYNSVILNKSIIKIPTNKDWSKF